MIRDHFFSEVRILRPLLIAISEEVSGDELAMETAAETVNPACRSPAAPHCTTRYLPARRTITFYP